MPCALRAAGARRGRRRRLGLIQKRMRVCGGIRLSPGDRIPQLVIVDMAGPA